MTFDVLLVALAALVLSNVVLLVAALRTGLLRRSEDAATLHVGDRPMRTMSVASAPDRTVGPGPVRERTTMPESDASSGGPQPSAAPTASEPDAGRPVASDPAAISEPPAAPEPRTAARPDAAAVPTAVGGPPDRTPDVVPATRPKRTRRSPNGGAGASAGRGRRFTLPPIEVDHARTERVVLSLLTGDDEAPTGEMVDAWERMVGPNADGTGRRSAAVVALTLDGIEELADGAGRDTAERLVGAVLDAVRRSARASDRVASVGRGHFRVLLVDADDGVAARFVGRVRASVDRRLALAAAPVTLAAGWSEAASADRLEGAVRAAEERRRADAAARRQAGRTNQA